MTSPGKWVFGLDPLPQTTELAAVLRQLASMAVALERPHQDVELALADLRRAEERLRPLLPDSAAPPRVGAAADGDGRVYLDHSRDVGRYDPAFPEYSIDVDGDVANGSVTFPIVYEGPPGIVHGGVLATFFDCVVQHHNCDLGVAGKTTSLTLRYRRPTPLLTDLRFDIERVVDGDRIHSTARLLHDTELQCTAVIEAVAGRREALPDVAPRREVR